MSNVLAEDVPGHRSLGRLLVQLLAMQPDAPSLKRSGWRDWWLELGDWWQTPASSSGQNHHGETQEEHALEVYELAKAHWRRVPNDKIRHCHAIRRSFLRAACFHDVGKALDRRAHDIAGYTWMLPRDPLAAYFIARHMGRWGSREISDLLECPPISRYHAHPILRFVAELLQACDYTAAHSLSSRSS